MICRQLWFTGPYQVEVREQALGFPAQDEVLVQSLYSAVSGGTEMLVYRGQLPAGMALDSSLETLKDQQNYPLQYGYATVGRVQEAGGEVEESWHGRLVFAFQPHASHFITTPSQLVPLPEGTSPLAAVFLANMETAVNLVLDGNPRLGEQVVILGQGIVGLLISSLLADFPLDGLYALDRHEKRRARAEQAGVWQALDPGSGEDLAGLKRALSRAHAGSGADLIYELSGTPDALNLAMALCGFSGRIVVGSWYGTKSAPLDLGGEFHRNRMHIISSQVSTIAPELSGRWDKSRRFQAAWNMIHKVRPEQLVTRRLPLSRAAELYRQLHEAPAEVLQAVFTYQD